MTTPAAYAASEQYLEDLLALVESFRYELCSECLRDVERHVFAPDPLGNPHIYCQPQWVVSDFKDASAGVLGRFDSENEAAVFIGTLPECSTGRYNLDGPGEDD